MLAEFKYSLSHTCAGSAAIPVRYSMTVDEDAKLWTRRRQLVPSVPVSAAEGNQQVDPARYNAESAIETPFHSSRLILHSISIN